MLTQVYLQGCSSKKYVCWVKVKTQNTGQLRENREETTKTYMTLTVLFKAVNRLR